MSEWNNYGFPDPTFYPVWKVAEGLVKALEERKLVKAQTWDIDSILNKTQYEIFSPESYDAEQNPVLMWRTFRFWFDQKLGGIAHGGYTYYGNIEYVDTPDTSPWYVSRLDDLLLKAAGGDPSEVIPPYADFFTIEWNVKWAIQRKKVLDMLRYIVFPWNPIIRGFDSWSDTNWPPGIRDFEQIDYFHMSKSKYGNRAITGIVYFKTSILPSAIGKPVTYTYHWIGSENGTFPWSDLGNTFPFVVGDNVLTADSNGIFLDDPSYLTKAVQFNDNLDPGDSGIGVGATLTREAQWLVADYSQVFKFYDPPET